MKRKILLILGMLLIKGTLFAQEMEHMGEQQHGNHDFMFTKPGAAVANSIVWISVAVVVFTLYLTLKYIFFPGENNPKHIKYIVTDGYIEKNYGDGGKEG